MMLGMTQGSELQHPLLDTQESGDNQDEGSAGHLSVAIGEIHETAAAPAALNNANKSQDLRSEIWSWVGCLTTLLAMIPQGIFGMLLADRVLIDNVPNASIFLRIGIDTAIFITATLGKYALIHFYNDTSFRGIPKYKLSNFLVWNFKSISNYLFSIVASGLFAYLAHIGLNGAADLARKYNSAEGDAAANIFESWEFKIWFVAASFFANMLSWNGMKDVPGCDGMHKISANIAIGTLKETYVAFTDMSREQTRLLEEAKMTHTLNKVTSNYNKLVKELKKPKMNDNDFARAMQSIITCGGATRDNVKIEQIADGLFNKLSRLESNTTSSREQVVENIISLANNDPERLRARLLGVAEKYQPDVSVGLSVLGRCLGLVFTGLCVVGFTNFWNITTDMSNDINMGPAAPLLSAMDMVSMTAMAFLCTFGSGSELLNRFRPETKRKNPEVLSTATKNLILALVVFTAALGGTPNAYQAYAIVGQALSYVIFSLYASAHVEFGGLQAVMTSFAKKRAMPKLNRAAAEENLGVSFEKLDQAMNALSNLHAPLPEAAPRTALCCYSRGNRLEAGVGAAYVATPNFRNQ